MKNLKSVIIEILTKDRTLADNEKLLNWFVWERFGGSLNNLTFETYKKLPSESSIQRIRRLVESEYPLLRGDSYLKRTTVMEQKVRTEIKTI
jgi:hypothetical protein